MRGPDTDPTRCISYHSFSLDRTTVFLIRTDTRSIPTGQEKKSITRPRIRFTLMIIYHTSETMTSINIREFNVITFTFGKIRYNDAVGFRPRPGRRIVRSESSLNVIDNAGPEGCERIEIWVICPCASLKRSFDTTQKTRQSVSL